MKRIIRVICILAVATMLFVSAYAESGWYCPACGRYNLNNYCPFDGTKNPMTESISVNMVNIVPTLSDMYPGKDAHLRILDDEETRVFSYTGPSHSYVSSGGYKPYKQQKITVYFEEANWVLADVVYRTAEERFVFLPRRSFDNLGLVPSVSDLDFYEGITISEATPSWGPAERFNSVPSMKVSSGTNIKVFFQENGFVYAEYDCYIGKTRMWLPANTVEVWGAEINRNANPIIPAGESKWQGL